MNVKIIETNRDRGYEINLCQDENDEYFIESELNGELFRTKSKERAEVRYYNIIMDRF